MSTLTTVVKCNRALILFKLLPTSTRFVDANSYQAIVAEVKFGSEVSSKLRPGRSSTQQKAKEKVSLDILFITRLSFCNMT